MYPRIIQRVGSVASLLLLIQPVLADSPRDDEVENLVRRSYQYVAMYNVNNKFAMKQGGWNSVDPDTELKDHTLREIARPNNDTLYIICMLDLRQEPLVLEMPKFDSDYVSLMITGYDHYVNIPMSTRQGNFDKPEKMLLFTERTESYDGGPVDGVDRLFECTSDFVSAVLRVMPHGNDEARFERIVEQMKQVKLTSLSEFRGGERKPLGEVDFPPVGDSDADVFENNLLEVMQFVFNHTTFDPDNAEDQAVLAAYKSLGVEPGKSFDAKKVAKIDGKQVRGIAQKIQRKWLRDINSQEIYDAVAPVIFQPKGETSLDAVIATSITGPIGIPQEEAVYPQLVTTDGAPLNAQHDYVIRMSADEMPPAKAFWSLTLYDLAKGFFIPNDRKKYSVGKNAGMKLDEDGGIEIHIAAEQPKGVPEENWLPIERKDLDLSSQFRLYVPDLEKLKTWTPPKAEKVTTPEASAATTSESELPGVAPAVSLDDAEIENLVRRSYQYVAMYNVNNKCADDQVQGWNKMLGKTELLDHTVQVIARPNNDTLYIASMLDLRKEPVILDMPAFDSKYASLLVSGYDHYVTIPLASRLGDFRKPTKILFYSARTDGYGGEAVEGIDKVFEGTGDFLQATVRVMPHAGDPERFQRIVEQVKSFKLLTLSEYRGEKRKPSDEVAFPDVGETDADIFENNLLEVMQFVFNHTSFDEANELDRALLTAYEPLGVAPGRTFDANQVAKIDGKRFRAVAERVFAEEMAKATDPAFAERQALTKFLPKGEIELDIMVYQSVLGPIGLPAVEAVYAPLESQDGKPLNASHDYVIRIAAEDMPPQGAFWSMTLYDFDRGFFIPNERKKYSVGENGGMKLAEDGSIEVHIAAAKPEGVPEENWLPISRKDEAMDVVLRIYAPDLEKFKAWQAPKAEQLSD